MNYNHSISGYFFCHFKKSSSFYPRRLTKSVRITEVRIIEIFALEFVIYRDQEISFELVKVIYTVGNKIYMITFESWHILILRC